MPPLPPHRDRIPPPRLAAPTFTTTRGAGGPPRAAPATQSPPRSAPRPSSAAAPAAGAATRDQRASAGAAPTASAVPAGPRARSVAAPPASTAAARSAGGAAKSEPLSMRVIRAALEEVCASAVSDISDLLCCPITHVRARMLRAVPCLSSVVTNLTTSPPCACFQVNRTPTHIASPSSSHPCTLLNSFTLR